jgi:uncharacterized protein YigA (DUF484 family)
MEKKLTKRQRARLRKRIKEKNAHLRAIIGQAREHGIAY